MSSSRTRQQLSLIGFLLATLSAVRSEEVAPLLHMKAESVEELSLAYLWLDVAQEATAREVDRNAPRATTFTAVAELAALSRSLGGYHIPADHKVGLSVGREIAMWSWPHYQAYFEGTAPVRR